METYCLRCFARIESSRAVRTVCPRCGHVNLAAARRTVWNENPRLRAVERLLKVLVLTATLVGAGLLLPALAEDPRLLFFVLAVPVLAGVLLWKTAGLLTRREPYFRPAVYFHAALAMAAFYVLSVRSPRMGQDLAVLGCAALLVQAATTASRRWKRRLTHGADG